MRRHTMQGEPSPLRGLVADRAAHSPRAARASPRPFDALPLAGMSLRVADLACARGAVQILAGVSFELRPGQVLVVRGPNGAGKTTLLRTIAGLTPPLAGTIAGGGETIAYAGHADGLKAQMTVAENLRFWAGVFGADDIAPAIAAFDLAPLEDRRAGELSAGQKRRLSLARLLVTGRPLWCLDEPTASLDAESAARFATAVEGHVGRGGMAVIATHLDLGLPEARVLDIAPFAARRLRTDDPFAGDTR